MMESKASCLPEKAFFYPCPRGHSPASLTPPYLFGLSPENTPPKKRSQRSLQKEAKLREYLAIPHLSLRPRFIGGSNLTVVLEIAELVPSVTEESRSKFASAMPRNRYAPHNDDKHSQTFPFYLLLIILRLPGFYLTTSDYGTVKGG